MSPVDEAAVFARRHETRCRSGVHPAVPSPPLRGWFPDHSHSPFGKWKWSGNGDGGVHEESWGMGQLAKEMKWMGRGKRVR